VIAEHLRVFSVRRAAVQCAAVGDRFDVLPSDVLPFTVLPFNVEPRTLNVEP
jgi:hypothetical protein